MVPSPHVNLGPALPLSAGMQKRRENGGGKKGREGKNGLAYEQSSEYISRECNLSSNELIKEG